MTRRLTRRSTRRFLVPEVVQTSALDCGPAALKALLEGFGISASYGRLREACQTGVDGTSIDQIEETAIRLGLEAEQVMMPADHALLESAGTLPALFVVRLPSGITHFVVAWRRHGAAWIQLMDPATGRLWTSLRQFQSDLYVHTQVVPAEDWREWAGSDPFLNPLRERLRRIGVSGRESERLVQTAMSDPGWQTLGALDAGIRMLDALVEGKGVRKGSEAARLLASLTSRATSPTSENSIPERYWSARPGEPGELLLKGAVLLRIRGRVKGRVRDPNLSAELTAALDEKPASPGLALWKMLRADGLLAPVVLALAMAIAAGTVLCEGLLFRGLLDLGQSLTLNGQRLWALGAILALVTGMLLLEWPIAAGILQSCRKLECRFRLAFLRKIPRLTDRYFQSRLISDMAERSHSVHQLRRAPEFGAQFLRSSFELTATVAGIAWFFPEGAFPAIAAGAITLGLPLLIQPFLGGRDLRVRNRLGALSVSYLDALVGATALKAHGAERPMRREHAALLADWARAGLDLQKAMARADTLQFAVCLAFSAWLLIRYLTHTGELGGALLLAYWALNLPMIGQEAAAAAWQYPRMRNIALRLMEPLGAPEENIPEEHGPADRTTHERSSAQGVSIEMEGITVRAAGHSILEDVDLQIPASSHIGIVGSSGAGKSSLVGLLLGWHPPATGSLRVDGVDLNTERLEQLRRETAWVDPTVQLWNQSLIDNLRYGLSSDAPMDIETVLDSADLAPVLQKLPEGMQCSLGEGGALVSGGEGQRVRLGRGMLRRDARLVILDEPACGLDRASRRKIVERCREHWHAATLLCITHDVADTLRFPRVLVIEAGHLVEDGSPIELAADPASRYRALLDAETLTRKAWSAARWRRLALREGNVTEEEEVRTR